MLIKSTYIDNIYIYNEDILKESIFFDIETTGLNPKYSKIVMIGILYFENGNYTLTQLFSEEDGEKEVIQEFINIMMNFRYLISYNGNSFDLRFIKKRAQVNNLNFSLRNKCLIDLLKVFRIHRDCFNTKNLKLKTVEKFSDIGRKDQLSGKDFIKLYTSYLLSPKKEYLELMWQHNFEDIINLPKLFNNYNLFENYLSVTYKEYILDVFINNNSLNVKNNRINVNANTYNISTFDTIINDFNYKLEWIKDSGVISLEILAKKGKLKDGRILNYINLKDVFKLDLSFKNNLNIPENFLVFSIDGSPNKNNILSFISLLFEYKKIP